MAAMGAADAPVRRRAGRSDWFRGMLLCTMPCTTRLARASSVVDSVLAEYESYGVQDAYAAGSGDPR